VTNPLRIAFCTTCKGRAQHVRKTLPQNLADNADYENAVFIMVNYGTEDTLMEELKEGYSDYIESERLVVYSVKDAGTFKMAHAKNIAHRLGIMHGADILVNLDADNMTGPGFATYINEQFQQSSQIYMWAKMITGVLPRGISGRIVVTKQQFLLANGYDEAFETWGRDDKDFNERLFRLGFKPHQIPDKFLCGIRHTDRLRFKEYPHVKALVPKYEDPTPPPNTHTICNYGFFGICIVTRNWEEIEIELGPLPTRIFGIGMHKTGTTSLHTALNILGYNSAHWKGAGWAKKIWNQFLEFGHSELLEKNYAVCDLPITLLYEKLDKLYPGSKFILTIRDEEEWIQSVENHWSYELNPYRASWNKDNFTHRLHKVLYGQQTFDREVMLARYRKHNADVIEYFKGRDEDLLILRVDKNIDWTPLSKFLGNEIPPVPFPKSNATPTKEELLLPRRTRKLIKAIFIGVTLMIGIVIGLSHHIHLLPKPTHTGYNSND